MDDLKAIQQYLLCLRLAGINVPSEIEAAIARLIQESTHAA